MQALWTHNFFRTKGANMNHIEAMKQGREALRKAMQGNLMFDEAMEAFKKVEQAIARAEHLEAEPSRSDIKQEPVAYDVRCDTCGGDGYDPKDNNYFCSSCEGSGFLEKLFYTHPYVPTERQPKQEPLMPEQIREFYNDNNNFELTGPYVIAFARAIEAAHGIKEITW